MAPSSAPFWRGRPSRRSRARRRPGALRRLVSSMLAVGLLSLVTLGVVQILSNLSKSEHFRVRALSIDRASEELRSRLSSRLQGMLGTSLFDVDLALAARSLEKDPWVRRAVVKRWLPGTLQVTVEERRPAALGTFRGRTVLVDTEGWPIDSPARELPELPKLTGIPARSPEQFAAQAAAALAALARVRREAPELLHGLTEIDLSVSGALVLKRGRELPQIWLARDDAARNLANYRRVQPEIDRRFAPLAAVDLRWRDQIALRPGQSAPGPGAGERVE